MNVWWSLVNLESKRPIDFKFYNAPTREKDVESRAGFEPTTFRLQPVTQHLFHGWVHCNICRVLTTPIIWLVKVNLNVTNRNRLVNGTKSQLNFTMEVFGHQLL